MTAVGLNVRGEIPTAVQGSFIVAMSRRDKRHDHFSRWHDSQADLVRIDVIPGRPGRASAQLLEVDPSGASVGDGFASTEFDRASYRTEPRYGYATQPNHGLNLAGNTLWATNLLFGAPLEIDVPRWRATRILRYVTPSVGAPRVSGTSHFAWSLDGRYAYFHQSLFAQRTNGPVATEDLRLVRLDVRTGAEKIWTLIPPDADRASSEINFHSAFYFEEAGKRFVGLLKTGAIVENLAPHTMPFDHTVIPMTASTIWIVELDENRSDLKASLLAGIREVDGLALSHLDVDNRSGDGFVLFANYKEADVAEETHGSNIFDEAPEVVSEHYAGMTVQPINVGQVIRVARKNGTTTIRSFKRHYDVGRTSLGHTWMPINIELDESRSHLFCSFAGLRPRLVPRHISTAYPTRVFDPKNVSYVPPVLMRFDADTLEPEYSKRRDYLSYAEPIAMTVVGRVGDGYVCTFSPEVGLRMYRADDLSTMVAHINCHPIWQWGDTHFHPEPAHMIFAAR
ncbi:MAG: hypothetical protein JO197_18120 [Acidobacteria bacterium]|nr:hypothetical protein [Acidobacteriota bacterium]MBV9479022.1 hypothetical protein [Acidobacteriota bacterium]